MSDTTTTEPTPEKVDQSAALDAVADTVTKGAVMLIGGLFTLAGIVLADPDYDARKLSDAIAGIDQAIGAGIDLLDQPAGQAEPRPEVAGPDDGTAEQPAPAY